MTWCSCCKPAEERPDLVSALEKAIEHAENLPSLTRLADVLRWYLENGATDEDLRRVLWKVEDTIDLLNEIARIIDQAIET